MTEEQIQHINELKEVKHKKAFVRKILLKRGYIIPRMTVRCLSEHKDTFSEWIDDVIQNTLSMIKITLLKIKLWINLHNLECWTSCIIAALKLLETKTCEKMEIIKPRLQPINKRIMRGILKLIAFIKIVFFSLHKLVYAD